MVQISLVQPGKKKWYVCIRYHIGWYFKNQLPFDFFQATGT